MEKQILICGGAGCLSGKSGELASLIKDKLKEKALENSVQVVLTGCFGFCEKGPIIKVLPEELFYIEVKADDVTRIVEDTIINGSVISDLLYQNPQTGVLLKKEEELDFYKKQKRIALRNCGLIDPENMEDYLKYDGYKALKKVLGEYSSQEVVEVIKESGLRGRGGGGFPTGLKWEFVLNNTSPNKYVVCNADEGDPGAFMDRSILEGDPYSILEAMAICGYATGSKEGLIYVRAEYPVAIKRLNKVMKDAKEHGFLGKNILGSGFDFDIEIKYGAGAFVCGEETALINSMEGKRGEPNYKPPYPAESGYWNEPTNVNNVETFANIPEIILKGADWFRGIGTEKSPGTKVFALAGKINNVGLVEVPMGTSLREVIFEIGGGIKDGKKFKAIQTGGPSGGCLTVDDLDTKIDFDTLTAKGSMMGSGGMIVLDEDDCMVAVPKFYLDFIVDESCGKCTPCRVGNIRLYEIIDKITKGLGTEKDLELLKELSNTIKKASLCGLGQTAPNPVLSTLDKFWDEYIAHVVDKKCPAGQCTGLLNYVITDKCIGCTACARACPVVCISGEARGKHEIDQSRCIKCGSCMEACKFDAIIKK